MLQPLPLDYARPRAGPSLRLKVSLALLACLVLLFAGLRVASWLRVREQVRRARVGVVRTNWA